MMTLEQIITDKLRNVVKEIYLSDAADGMIQLQSTRKDFDGDLTLVVFPLLKLSKKSPEQTAEEIGKALKDKLDLIDSYNVIKGFLNLKISSAYWNDVLSEISKSSDYGQAPSTGKTIMIEFSSPNTNKPLHLGHIRNILLGSSVADLLSAAGHNVMKVNLVNDRGIHICKSMLAWEKTANGKTPESSGIKGDHLVGDYYVAFNNLYKEEVDRLVQSGMPKEEAEKNAPVLKEAQAMLVKWENGDRQVRDLWQMMNGWVYAGFDQTYRRLGITFDKTYYESQTYLSGKSIVKEGLEKGVFEKHEDGSVWCDLTADGLDKKLLLRADGTSVYMTQDLGTAKQRFDEYNLDEHIYVVGNEQNYHFQVLKLVLKKLGFPWADSIYHLSYGMVELPEGKMKSREGTVVDADDLIDDMYSTAKETSLKLGKIDSMSAKQQDELFEMVGLGALKYFILKVDPKKTMLFDPKESIDFNGNTGPFIQYTYARIKSILRKACDSGFVPAITKSPLEDKEVSIIKMISAFPARISEAANVYSPAMIANYAYDLAKEFNQYYHDISILRESDAAVRDQRLALVSVIATVLEKAMGILGIRLPERM